MQEQEHQNQTMVSQKIQFYELCKVFDSIKSAQKQEKAVIFKNFIKKWHQELKKENADGSFEFRSDDSFFDALRLFMPGKDERKFGLKEVKLTRLVCDVLMTPQMELSASATEVLVEKLAQRVCESLCNQSPVLSIKQINSLLDGMKFPTEKRHQERIMSEIFRACTKLELRWIFHIILENMEKALGIVSSFTIFRWFHKDALDSFLSGNSLQQICSNFVGEESGENILSANGNLLCKPFRPMLLKRLNFDKYCLPKIIKFCTRPFYAEIKYDGEHLLVHRYNSGEYKYFTRNGIDYTHKMGPDSGSFVSARIHPYMRPDVREFALDCELILWDTKIQSFVGKNKRSSDGKVYDIKHIDEDYIKNHAHLQRCLVVFDILFFNGKSLVDEPLVERLKYLGKVFKEEDKSVVFVSKKEILQTAEAFASYYRNAMRNGEEGIVVKAFHSIYRPGSRAERNGWFKIKPDYGVQSVLDLAVVGMRYENGSLDNIKSFLVAARIPGPNLSFKIVAGITSHLKLLDFKRLLELLRVDKTMAETTPEWLKINNGSAGKNDRFVSMENIQVVEVRASGLLNGILQFPSIVSIRNDKPVLETDTINDVLRFDERIRSRPITCDSDPHEAAVLLNRRPKQNISMKTSHQLVKDDGTLEGTISEALKGKKVCVLNGTPKVSVQDLQKILITLGATLIANPGKTADFLVAMDKKPINCVAAIKADNYHIVHGNWLLACREKGALLPWNQSDMIHESSKAEFDLFSLPSAQDENGEKQARRQEGSENGQQRRTEDGEEEDNDNEMIRIANMAISEEQKICGEVNSMVADEDCDPATRGNLFMGFVFFVHESVKDDAKSVQLMEKIESQNGKISESLNAEITHVVIDKMNSDQGDFLFTWDEEQKQWTSNFVTTEWVEQAIADEDRYRKNEQLHNWIR